jgi:hypothetical protein
MTCTIPGFVPGADYYAASGVLEMGQQIFRHLGLTDRRGFDIFTTMVAGLIDQRLANDPGGTRWLALQNRRSISGPTASAFPQTRRRETGGQLNTRPASPDHRTRSIS